MTDDNAAAGEAEPQAKESYADMSVEQLDDLLRGGAGEIVPDTSEDASAAEQQETPQEEAAPVEEAPETVTEDHGTEVVEEPADEPSLTDLQLQEQRLLNESLTQRLKREADLRSHSSGEVGHLRQTVDQLKAQLAQPSQASDDDYGRVVDAPPAQRADDGGMRERLVSLEQENLSNSVVAEASEWKAELLRQIQSGEIPGADAANLEVSLQAIEAELREPLANGLSEIKDQFGTARPKFARRLLRGALDTALTDVKIARIRKLQQAAVERKTSSVSQRRIAKQNAAISGSGSSAPPREKQKTADEMTWQEADAALKQEYGTGRARLRG